MICISAHQNRNYLCSLVFHLTVNEIPPETSIPSSHIANGPAVASAVTYTNLAFTGIMHCNVSDVDTWPAAGVTWPQNTILLSVAGGNVVTPKYIVKLLRGPGSLWPAHDKEYQISTVSQRWFPMLIWRVNTWLPNATVIYWHANIILLISSYIWHRQCDTILDYVSIKFMYTFFWKHKLQALFLEPTKTTHYFDLDQPKTSRCEILDM